MGGVGLGSLTLGSLVSRARDGSRAEELVVDNRHGPEQQDELDHQHAPPAEVVGPRRVGFHKAQRQQADGEHGPGHAPLAAVPIWQLPLPAQVQRQDKGEESEFKDVHVNQHWQLRQLN